LQAGVAGKSFSTFTATQYATDPRSYGGKVRYITPKWDWIDPLKDLSAEKLAVDAGFKPRSDVIEAMGEDPHEVDARIKADQDRAEELGLEFKQVSTGIVVSPTAEVEPAPAPVDPNSPLDPNPNGGKYPENSPTPKGPRQPPKARRNAPARYSWDR
jgi:hypothetical protein